MKRTIKIKADFPKEIILPLLKIANALFNDYVEWSFINHSYNKNKCHAACYDAFTKKYSDLSSGIVQSIRDMAMESVKVLRFNKYPKKKTYSGIRMDKRTCTLRGNQLTISTLGKRAKTILKIPKYFQEVFDTWKFTGLQLCYDTKKDKCYVCLGFDKANPKFEEGEVLGIDRGIINVVACSNGYVVPGKRRNRIKRQYSYQRKQLQAKGTRSAHRLKKKVSGKEQRFSLNENHILSKEISNLPYQVFVIEKLEEMSKKGKKIKRMNRRLSNWSFKELETLLKYKLEEKGKRLEYVDARYTSQRCNGCGSIKKSNRKGIVYHCKKCGYKENADINAAKNIRDLWMSAGASIKTIPQGQGAVNRPNVLPRYSKDQSHQLGGDGTSSQASPVGNWHCLQNN